MRFKQQVVLISLIVTLTSLLSGCGRGYHIKGRVVLLPELGADESLILEFTGKSLPEGGTPLVGAKVRMIHQLDKDDRPVKDEAWTEETVTDERGFFEIHDYAAPSSEAKVGLEVSGGGYQTAYRTYIDYSDVEPQVFFVVLVPTRSANNGMHPTADTKAVNFLQSLGAAGDAWR
jgi:hypothetical protein